MAWHAPQLRPPSRPTGAPPGPKSGQGVEVPRSRPSPPAGRRDAGSRSIRGQRLPAPAFPESPIELSAFEAAEFLRVEPNTIYHEAATNRLPAWKEGHEWRTTASALREYLTSDPDPSGRYVRGGGSSTK